MKKITKKEFRETMENNSSTFVSVVRDWSRQRIQDGIDNLSPNRVKQIPERRHVKKKQTNGIQFNNGSWLRFDQLAKYSFYQHIANKIKYLIAEEDYKGDTVSMIYAVWDN